MLPDSQQLPADSKTIDISLAKRANVFTAAFRRFLNINPPIPQGVERVRPQTQHRSQPATFLNQHAKRPSKLTKHQPATSTKLKPAASIEESNNRVIEASNSWKGIDSGSGGSPDGPPEAARGCHRPAKLPGQPASKYKNQFIENRFTRPCYR